MPRLAFSPVNQVLPRPSQIYNVFFSNRFPTHPDTKVHWGVRIKSALISKRITVKHKFNGNLWLGCSNASHAFALERGWYCVEVVEERQTGNWDCTGSWVNGYRLGLMAWSRSRPPHCPLIYPPWICLYLRVRQLSFGPLSTFPTLEDFDRYFAWTSLFCRTCVCICSMYMDDLPTGYNVYLLLRLFGANSLCFLFLSWCPTGGPVIYVII